MSKWLEKQLKYSFQLLLPKKEAYVVKTNNPTLADLFTNPSYQESIQQDMVEEIKQDCGEFLIKELVGEYKRSTGKDSEWGISHRSPGMEGNWEACIYLIPTPKEINFKLKTKKWEWSRDWEGMGVKTVDHWWHIGCFSPKNWKPRVFIKVEKTKQN